MASPIVPIRITLVGVTPLLCHNIRLANPDDYFAKAIREITNKPGKDRTEADRRRLADLEWEGSLYLFSGVEGPGWPSYNIKVCIGDGAKARRLGTSVLRALSFRVAGVAIDYIGPRDIDQLRVDDTFRDSRLVGVKTARSMRTRPFFREWSMTLPAFLNLEAMNFDTFCQVVSLAGEVEGLGEARLLGYGRFMAEVVRL